MKKKWVLWEEIWKQIDSNRAYSEIEISNFFKQFNEDYCYLRRSFVEEGILNRNDSIYSVSEKFKNYMAGQFLDLSFFDYKNTNDIGVRELILKQLNKQKDTDKN